MVHAQRHAQKLFGRLGWVGSGVTQEDPEEQLTWLLSKMLGEAAQEYVLHVHCQHCLTALGIARNSMLSMKQR